MNTAVESKDRWHAKNRALLSRVAAKLGIATKDRKVSSNKGGPAVGGEVTLVAPTFGVYVSLSCPVNAYGEANWCGVSYARRATVADPYGTGTDKPNHTFDATSLREDDLVAFLRKIARGGGR